ncbi:MAG: LacI family DNA-binding transcriptional regulator [Spirochaetales bacterium]|nr:LacI family DNA-binding transcriptional regulator [Spirochaetales bacterium]
MSKKVTLYDIAEELNISPSTVSRVLNNSTLISDERSRQILETAERLGYRKRPIRKHMSRAILNIHLFLPVADNSVSHFFYNISELIEAVQEGFGDVRLNFVTRINDGNLEFLERKKTGQIDGCIFAFTKPGARLASELDARHIPFILLNRKGRKGSSIYYDAAGGMKLIARRLWDARGESLKPCFIGFKGLKEVSRDRFNASLSVFGELGLGFSEADCYDIPDFSCIKDEVVPWIISGGYNAVIAFNDVVALTLLHNLTLAGKSVPGDMALTGVDKSPLQSIFDTKIDTVSLSIHELGRRAGEWLQSWIMEKNEEPLRLVLDCEYVPGETIGS